MHGSEDLDLVARVETEAFRDPFGDEVLQGVCDCLGRIAFDEEKVGFGVVFQLRADALIHLVCGGDDAAGFGLAIDAVESRHSCDFAVYNVPEDISRPDGGKLIDVANEYNAAVRRNSGEKARHELDVDHGCLIDDEKIALERIGRVAGESGLGLNFEKAMDCQGLVSGALKKTFRCTAGRSAEDGFYFFCGQDLEDGIEDRRFSHSGTAGDNGEAVVSCGDDGSALIVAQIDVVVSLEPVDCGTFVDRGQRRGAGDQAGDGISDDRFGFVRFDGVDKNFVARCLHHDLVVEGQGIECVLNLLLRAAESGDGLMDQFGAGESTVTVALCLFQHVLDSGAEAFGRIIGTAHLPGDVISGFESDSRNVVGEPVGILTEDVGGLGAVGFIQPKRAGGGKAVLVEENHYIADGFLPVPRFFDLDPPFFPNSLDLLKLLRLLFNDSESFAAEFCDNALGICFSDAFDQAAGEKAFDARCGVRRSGQNVFSAELSAEAAIIRPAPGSLDFLALSHGWNAANYGHIFASVDRDVHDGIAVFFVVKNDRFDGARYFIGFGQVGAHETGIKMGAILALYKPIPVSHIRRPMAILSILLTVIIVAVSILIVLIVLIQRPKQEGLGAAFGGGTLDSALGAHTTDVLQKATTWLGVIFFVSAIGLAMVKTREFRASAASDVLENVEKREPQVPGLPPELSDLPVGGTITPDPAPTDPAPASDAKSDDATPAAPAKTDAPKEAAEEAPKAKGGDKPKGEGNGKAKAESAPKGDAGAKAKAKAKDAATEQPAEQ